MQVGEREKKLEALGYPLDRGPKEGPVIDLLSVVGDIVFASGQVPFDAGVLTSKGKVPSQVSVEQSDAGGGPVRGQRAAGRVCKTRVAGPY